jgi:AIPR protein
MALVSLFKTQLENESAALAVARGLTKRGDQLVWWYFTKLFDLAPGDVESIICDGFNDLGIDAIWIDDESLVHFYNFKNPFDQVDAFPSVEVDKLLGGLNLILTQKHKGVANPALQARVDEIYAGVPTAYRVHLVTSGTGMAADVGTKLDAFIAGLKNPSAEWFTWQLEDLPWLQEMFYRKSLPTVDDALELTLEQSPYFVRSADHDCYMFHLNAEVLAAVYDRFRERLLQQNIRVYQGDRSTNAVIRKTSSSPDSGNFFHYNNGVVLLAESADWDPFTKKLRLRRFQVVNGGQTIRVLHQAWGAKELRTDVLVPVRTITSRGDKDFGNNVTVNLNNQNRIEPSFLRSNDPRIMQLANALASEGWYLERRENEVAAFTPGERAAAETRIGRPLAGRVIRMKEGLQAYTATFMHEPELAKKNPKRIFLGVQDGGIFDRVFSADLTAQNVIAAHTLATLVSEYVKQFMTKKRRKDSVENWRADYESLLGPTLVKRHAAVIDQVLPQSAIFLSAIAFDEWVNIRKRPLEDLLKLLENKDYETLNEKIGLIIDFVKETGEETKSWPTLLKSQPLFENFSSFLRGRITHRPVS